MLGGNACLVIKLEEWDKEKEYDRLGLEEEYIEFLVSSLIGELV